MANELNMPGDQQTGQLRERLRGTAPVAVDELIAFAQHARSGADCALVSRRLKSVPDDEPGLRHLRVAVLRTCTVEPLIPHFEAACLRRGICARFTVGNFNSITQDLLAGDPGLDLAGADVILIWVRLAELDPALWSGYARLFPKAEAAIQAALERVTDWARRASARSGRPVLVTNLEQPREPAMGLYDTMHPQGQGYAIAELNRRLAAAFQGLPGVHLLDLARAQALAGVAHWFDAKLAALAGFPYAAAAHPILAEACARLLRALVVPPRKCLVVDLDNTLWQGVLGEDGEAGIKLGPDFPGGLFQDFQRQILGLRDRGILLAIASKNNADEALAVLTTHAHMILRPEHFAARRINWNDKTRSLREIAAELNIGTDALVFLDDNPAECARVRQQMPEVLVVEVPSDPLRLGEVFGPVEAFDALLLSSEDRARGEMYQQQTRRQELLDRSGTIEDFYRSLQMVLTIGEAGRPTIPRIAQLTQKTNQFNLTTRRFTEEQVAQLAADGMHRIFWVGVRDVFGDNGLVATAVVRVRGEEWEIVNLLMSCRVIQRTVETALLAHLVTQARAAGARIVRGEIRRTPKNEPARDFYQRHGFRLLQPGEEHSVWEADLAKFELDTPPWFTLLVDSIENKH